MLSFVEAFWMMAIMFLCMVPFLLLLRRPVGRAVKSARMQARPRVSSSIPAPERADEKVPVLLEH